MKQLSYWASNHVRASRWAIFGCYAAANLLGLFWGSLMYAAGWMSGQLLLAAFAIAVFAALLHPKKGRERAPAYTYTWHKGCDLAICLTTVCLLAFSTADTLKPAEPSYASFRQQPEQALRSVSGAAGRIKQKVSRFLEQAKYWYDDQSTGAKVALVTLAIVATVALCCVWAAIACNLSCNGLSFLAVLVAVVGIGGTIVGCVFLCRRIILGPCTGRRARQPLRRWSED